MSAKKAKRSISTVAAASVPAPAAANLGADTSHVAAPDDAVSWYDSPEPRKRRAARIALVVLWLYVAALWLLAMDQTFDWGIFGPKVPALD